MLFYSIYFMRLCYPYFIMIWLDLIQWGLSYQIIFYCIQCDSIHVIPFYFILLCSI